MLTEERKRKLREAEQIFQELSEQMAIIRRKYKNNGEQFVGKQDYDEAETLSMAAFEHLERLRRKYNA